MFREISARCFCGLWASARKRGGTSLIRLPPALPVSSNNLKSSTAVLHKDQYQGLFENWK